MDLETNTGRESRDSANEIDFSAMTNNDLVDRIAELDRGGYTVGDDMKSLSELTDGEIDSLPDFLNPNQLKVDKAKLNTLQKELDSRIGNQVNDKRKFSRNSLYQAFTAAGLIAVLSGAAGYQLKKLNPEAQTPGEVVALIQEKCKDSPEVQECLSDYIEAVGGISKEIE